MQQLVAVIYNPGSLDGTLKRMIATAVSGAAGCRYCQAHTAHGAIKMADTDAETVSAKIQNEWQFATDPAFTQAERAALNLALAAGQSPNAITDAHFKELEQYFSPKAIMEIVGVLGLFGF